MGSIETAVRYSKRFESLLEREYGAVGKGLHEKLSSVEDRLRQDNVKTIRWIATIRNRAVHEDGFEIDNLDEFIRTCEQLLEQLTGITEVDIAPVGKNKMPKSVKVFFLIIALLLLLKVAPLALPLALLGIVIYLIWDIRKIKQKSF